MNIRERLLQISQRNLIYIASPYTDLDPQVMRQRRSEVTSIAAKFKELYDLTMILPITTSAALVDANAELGHSWDYWQHDDRKFLSHSGAMIVVMLEGWSASTGVNAEIEFCREQQIPIFYYDPQSMQFTESELGEAYVT